MELETASLCGTKMRGERRLRSPNPGITACLRADTDISTDFPTGAFVLGREENLQVGLYTSFLDLGIDESFRCRCTERDVFLRAF